MDRRKSLSQLSQPDTLVRDRSLAHASGYDDACNFLVSQGLLVPHSRFGL